MSLQPVLQRRGLSRCSRPLASILVVDLPLVFLIGLLGSAHCIGMCGGFVALLGHARRGGQVWSAQLLYLSGKTATYAALGALAGGLGGAASLAVAGAQTVLSVTLGLVLVLVGLGLCGVFRSRAGAGRIAQRIAPRLGPAIAHLVRSERPASLVGLGALNGLLPCGLVYGMLAKASTTGSPLGGALTLAVFGIGTAPALLFVGRAGAGLPPARRLWLQRAGGVAVIALGVLTITRAAMAASLGHPPAPTSNAGLLCLP